MGKRNIRISGDDVLRKKSRKVEEINDRIIQLLDDMKDTMYESQGVGLAAPQVGVLRRVIIIDIGEGLIEMINPEIIFEEGEQFELEGCLSVPGKLGKVKRPMKIVAEGLDRRGVKIKIEAEGFLAKAFCHEIDHLNGILFIDIAEEFLTNEELEKQK